MSVLELEVEVTAPAPMAPTLAGVLLRALADPEGEPCPVCGGELERAAAGVECRGCGSRIDRGGGPARGAWVDTAARR